MNKFSCVIFDIDGTLTQTNDLIFDTFNHVTEKYLRQSFTPAEIIAMFGPPEEVAIERLVGADQGTAAMADFIAYYDHQFPIKAEAYEGIKEVVQQLHERGIKLAVFTGKGRSTTLITLDKIGIGECFDIVVTGSDVTNHKPSSEGIRKILDFLNVLPGNALMVGDAVSDIKAAHEAGVAVAAVLWDSYGKEKIMDMKVDYLFHSVQEFARWINDQIPGNGAIAR